jgi:uncharacterized protein YyaL (SSP411 family)
MANRLGRAVSPYLRSHADNPVDWQPWGSAAFAEAASRQVPVLISIGYSTCHWCHVMARESFSDPALAEYLNQNFVSIKVDREEHPDVDASYLAAAGAFTEQLGWPLTVFATPEGRAFYAGTYFPPVETQGLPAFRDVLEAMVDAWTQRREDVEDVARRLAAAITSEPRSLASESVGHGVVSLPGDADFAAIVEGLLHYEDTEFGGFGGAPKFPVAPVIRFLLDRADAGDDNALALATRTLTAMAGSPLRDRVEGGFFRYATQRDWSDPHYERMLYDNALLLECYARLGDGATAEGIASFLLGTLRLPSGGFASAQDSESTIDGRRVEGGYYLLDAAARAHEQRPALDDKVLTGWNGLAIAALASAGTRLAHPEWIEAAVTAADVVSIGEVVRARIASRVSDAKPTLEDFGMLSVGLLELALATGEARFAVRARELVESCLNEEGFAVPGGADPVLEAHGLVLPNDPSEGAYPSGISAIATAAVRLHRLGAEGTRATGGLLGAAQSALSPVASLARERPIAFGGALGALSLLASADRSLVVVAGEPNSPIGRVANQWRGGQIAIVTPKQAREWQAAGFALFDQRDELDNRPTAYLCESFVCRLPVTDPSDLENLLEAR